MKPVITGAQNSHLKLYRSLGKRKTREEEGLLPLEGVRLVRDTIERGVALEIVLLRESESQDRFPFLARLSDRVPVLVVENSLFDRAAFTETPQGIMAVARRPVYILDDVFAKDNPLLLVVDQIQDPGNLGTMLRSAAATGACGAVLLPGSVDATNPKALRAAMGAFFALPVVVASEADLLRYLKKSGVRLVATGANRDLAYDSHDWTGPAAIVIGNEGAGISPCILAAADTVVSIPMTSEVESLNAAVAMSVLFFEAARQRRLQ